MLFVLLACSDHGFSAPADVDGWDASWGDEPTDGARALQVVPDPFDFGQVSTDCAEAGFDWFARNVGEEPVTVDEVGLVDVTWEVVFDVPGLPVTLQPGEYLQGTASYEPVADGGPTGSFWVYSDDPDAPAIERPLHGDSCADMDGDAICDEVDDDLDGDGIPNDDDPFPEHLTIDDEHVGFDELVAGTRVEEQYADLGVHFVGTGSPGAGWDTNVVQAGTTCTEAELSSSPNVLCTYVDDGFNHGGDPGLEGWLDEEADAVMVRMYTAGLAYAATNGADRDEATLVTFDVDGVELGRHTAMADTDSGVDYVDLQVLGPGAMSFELYTGDFDAVDDLHVLRLAEPTCE